MNKYIRKPVPIYAIQYDGGNFMGILQWEEEALGEVSGRFSVTDEALFLEDGVYRYSCLPGDYVVCDLRGELKIVPEGVFEEEYEEVFPE